MRFVNNMKTAMLLGSLMAICMLIGHWVGGPRGVMIGFLFGGLGNLIAYFFSDRIALASMRAQEASRDELPWLHDMVERLAARAGLPKPRVYVCPQPAPNAFATGRSPAHSAVAITVGMLRGFPQHEIEGVMAHEMAHIKHRDVLISTIAAVMAGMISQVAYMMMWFGGGGGDDRRDNPLGAVGMILMLVLAPIAAMLIQAAISRQREFAADSYGGELCGDPRKLATALARLQNGNERVPTDTNPAFHSMYIMEPLHSGVFGMFSTHPPTEQRIAALERLAREMARA
ncbi:hypothetical protein RAS1_25830 [Phycisphaerae bacterium RAS1]|nr:hypothetical protein RAS1_25830 [Phycisphaerae bacterium RAS1]